MIVKRGQLLAGYGAAVVGYGSVVVDYDVAVVGWGAVVFDCGGGSVVVGYFAG